MEKYEINIEKLIDDLSSIDPNYKNEIISVEEDHNCYIFCSIGKHNSLQYTYFYEVYFEINEILLIEIESGINNGTRINNTEWRENISDKYKYKLKQILREKRLKKILENGRV